MAGEVKGDMRVLFEPDGEKFLGGVKLGTTSRDSRLTGLERVLSRVTDMFN